MPQTTLDLIDNIKLRGSFPSANDLFSNQDYLNILSDEMMNIVTPVMQKLNEEYFLVYQDTLVTFGLEAYRIPKRAIGSTLRDVQIINNSGSITSLPRLFEEDHTSVANGSVGYYLKGNQVLISPIPQNTTDTLRLVYFRRPSRFVLPVSSAFITNVAGSIVTVSALPSNIANLVKVDLIQGSSPYDILSTDVVVTAVGGLTLTLNSVPADLAIGDYICLSGEGCTPMVPEEVIPFLVQAALCICLASKKDSRIDYEQKKLTTMQESLLGLLTPRVRSNDVKIQNSNSLLNFSRVR